MEDASFAEPIGPNYHIIIDDEVFHPCVTERNSYQKEFHLYFLATIAYQSIDRNRRKYGNKGSRK